MAVTRHRPMRHRNKHRNQQQTQPVDQPRKSSPTEAVLVVSPHSGRSDRLAPARRSLDEHGIAIAKELDIRSIDRLPELLRSASGEPRLVIAAGGDGTVGTVAGRLAGADNTLGILPLGTGNDVARALGIPLQADRAADLVSTGQVASVDLGRLNREGQPPAYFAHAATVGLNVDFSTLATDASMRERLGKLTYLAAAMYAVRKGGRFTCVLRHAGGVEELTLRQLSVISAPVIGGSLGLTVRSPYPDKHRLHVVAVGDIPPWRLVRASVYILLGVKRPIAGIRTLHVDWLGVECEHPLALTLDGELDGTLPGEFESVAGAVRVIVPADRSPSADAS
jgi:diacylglycerol kinase (ATP)